jgi:hypothetical protein
MDHEVINRAAATRRGLKFYFTGKACVNGHITLRRTSSCICEDCHRDLAAAWRDSNRERHNGWGKKNPDQRRISQQKYLEAHPDRRRKSQLDWIERNRDQHREYQRGLRKRRRQSDPDWRFRVNLRGRLHKALTRASAEKFGKTLELVGCSVPDLKAHLAALFLPGMDWSNYGHGRGRWNVDHRIPCAAFDLTNPDQQRRCFHFSNLQPLWHPDNVAKGARIDAQLVAI